MPSLFQALYNHTASPPRASSKQHPPRSSDVSLIHREASSPHPEEQEGEFPPGSTGCQGDADAMSQLSVSTFNFPQQSRLCCAPSWDPLVFLFLKGGAEGAPVSLATWVPHSTWRLMERRASSFFSLQTPFSSCTCHERLLYAPKLFPGPGVQHEECQAGISWCLRQWGQRG